MRELVSVVIPVYNRELTIERAVRSVLNQDYDNLEVIVVDDGSNDGTVDVVKSIKDERVRIILGMRRGACYARNLGIANSKGSFIAFQDSDDEWCSNKLSVQIQYMQREGLLACFCPYYLYDGADVTIVPDNNKRIELGKGYLKNILKNSNVIGTPTLVLSREALKLLGGSIFDESIPRMQDYELVIRLVQLTDIGYIDEPLVKAYRMEECITGNKLFLYEAACKILNKHSDFVNNEFLMSIIKSEIEYIPSNLLIEKIELIQGSILVNTVDVKSEIIMYLCNQLRNKNLVLKKLYKTALLTLKKRRFAFYGAGTVAKELYKSIYNKNLKPDAFLVTSINRESLLDIDGIPVLTAENYPNKDILVIISVSVIYQSEIIDNLMNLGYSQICVYAGE